MRTEIDTMQQEMVVMMMNMAEADRPDRDSMTGVTEEGTMSMMEKRTGKDLTIVEILVVAVTEEEAMMVSMVPKMMVMKADCPDTTILVTEEEAMKDTAAEAVTIPDRDTILFRIKNSISTTTIQMKAPMI